MTVLYNERGEGDMIACASVNYSQHLNMRGLLLWWLNYGNENDEILQGLFKQYTDAIAKVY